jgi:hypothetical protein
MKDFPQPSSGSHGVSLLGAAGNPAQLAGAEAVQMAESLVGVPPKGRQEPKPAVVNLVDSEDDEPGVSLPAKIAAGTMASLASAVVKAIWNKEKKRDEDSSDDDRKGPTSSVKGAVAFNRERERSRKHPGRRWDDFESRLKNMLGVTNDTQAWRHEDVLPRLPFGSFATMRRTAALLCEMGDAAKEENHDRVKMLIAQGLRWVVCSLSSKDQNLAWNMTFLPDPLRIQCTTRDHDILAEGLLDPRQVHAVLGMAKDQAALKKQLDGDRDPKAPPKKWEREKKEQE